VRGALTGVGLLSGDSSSRRTERQTNKKKTTREGTKQENKSFALGLKAVKSIPPFPEQTERAEQKRGVTTRSPRAFTRIRMISKPTNKETKGKGKFRFFVSKQVFVSN
jgi:hypothetical protein